MYINVLTYNVCWECISGESEKGSAKLYGKKCGQKKCYDNIVELCSSIPYTFICLQEGNIKLANGIIKKLKINNKGNYSKIVKKSGEANIIIIYRCDLFRTGNFTEYGYINEIGRPYLFQNFIDLNNDNVLYVGNIHGPHVDKNIDCLKWINNYMNKIFKNQKSPDKKIILMGDFNREIKKNINIKGLNINLKVLNKGDIKTAFNVDGNNANYKYGIDNILISNNIKNIYGPETINQKNLLLPNNNKKIFTHLSSDHKPLLCILKI